MKKILFLVLFLFTITHVSAFSDIENNWYKQSILELKDAGILSGYDVEVNSGVDWSDNKIFDPRGNITRSEILKIILSASETEIIEPEQKCFSDVATTSWQAKYICSWVRKGITKGYENGTFKPNWTVTVLETLAFGARAFDLDIDSLDNWKEWEKWYEKYQRFAHTHSIIPVHSYTVNTLISRWQAAEVINKMRIFSQKKEVGYDSIGCWINPNMKSWEYTIDIWWVERKYLLYVPSWMKKWKKTKLAVVFHGRTNSNIMVRDYMQLGGGKYWYKQNDFVVAYPAAKWPWPYSWSDYDNIELFDAIIREVSEKLCIDRDGVFTVGHSLWSYMSNKVSCLRWDVIRAMTGVASDGFRWTCTWPVASLIMHLPKDPLAWYSWWKRAYAIRTETNICSGEEKQTTIWDIKSCTQKASCSSGNTVFFCNSYATYWTDQHSWPKNWSDDILDFFRNIDTLSK